MDGKYVSSQESFQKMATSPVKKQTKPGKKAKLNVYNLAAIIIQKMARGHFIRHPNLANKILIGDFENLLIDSVSTGITETEASKKKGIVLEAVTATAATAATTATSSIATASVVDDEVKKTNFQDCLIIGGKLVEIKLFGGKIVRCDGNGFKEIANYASYGVHSCDLNGITCEDWISKKMGEEGGGKK